MRNVEKGADVERPRPREAAIAGQVSTSLGFMNSSEMKRTVEEFDCKEEQNNEPYVLST